MFVWFLNVLFNNWVISRMGPKTESLTILRAATHETERGDRDFCLSRSHYTDPDPTSRERAATAGIEPETSSPGVARSERGELLRNTFRNTLTHCSSGGKTPFTTSLSGNEILFSFLNLLKLKTDRNIQYIRVTKTWVYLVLGNRTLFTGDLCL